MATHGDIGLSQPVSSTITFKLDSITLDANSTAVHREVMVLGSPETTNALSAVLAAAPKSTDWGLAVRIVGGPSTVADFPVRVLLPSTVTDNLVRPIAPSTYGDGGLFRVAQSTAGDLNVTVAGYVAPSTIVSIGAFTSTAVVIVRQSTASDLLVRTIPPSTYADAGITRVQNSSAGDLLAKVTPLSTLWASSAGFHFDSSGALQTVASFTGSTDVTVNGNVSSNSSAYLPVRITNGTAFIDAQAFSVHGSTGDFTGSTIAGQPLLMRSGAAAYGSTDHFVAQWGSSMGAAFVIPVTDSGVSVMDSTARAMNVNVVAGSVNSTIVSIGAFTSTAVVIVRQSTASDLLVRPIAPSTYADAGISRVMQSSAGDLNVTVAGYVAPSTQVSIGAFVSTAVVIVRQSTASDLLVRPIAPSTYGDGGVYRVAQSSAGDLNVTVTGTLTGVSSVAGGVHVSGSVPGTTNSSNSSVYLAVRVSNGTAFLGASTSVPAHTVEGLHVRQVPSSYQSTVLGGASSNSTVLVVALASVASLSHKVYAYFIGASTSGNPSTVVFLSSGQGGDAGAAKNRWQVVLSSGYGAANLAISPAGGAFLFKTDASEALTYRIESASTRITPTISLSWMTEL